MIRQHHYTKRITMENPSEFSGPFSKKGFWAVIREHGSRIHFLRDAVAMYHCLVDEGTPVLVKTLIVGALGYFICPVDAVPDVAPIIGWLDDAGVIAATLLIVAAYITYEHWAKADVFLGG
jgi:uncharacterized membrane protein YkvA (DUF1232 family)